MIKSERLYILRSEVTDLTLAGKLYCDPDMMRYLGRPWQIDQVKKVLEMWYVNWGSNNHWYGTLYLDQTGEAIGMAGVTEDTLPGEPGFELSWFILTEYQNKGYATEITRRLVDFVFREAGGKRLVAETHPDNSSANRVFEKLGFTNHGVFHHHYDDLPDFDTQVLWDLTRG